MAGSLEDRGWIPEGLGLDLWLANIAEKVHANPTRERWERDMKSERKVKTTIDPAWFSCHASQAFAHDDSTAKASSQLALWPNGQGIGLLSR